LSGKEKGGLLTQMGAAVGEWKNGKKEGKGKHVWADGDFYEGEWKDDRMEGKGKYVWPNGNIYKGEWENGRVVWKRGEGLARWFFII
jgi:hypothetical protein